MRPRLNPRPIEGPPPLAQLDQRDQMPAAFRNGSRRAVTCTSRAQLRPCCLQRHHHHQPNRWLGLRIKWAHILTVSSGSSSSAGTGDGHALALMRARNRRLRGRLHHYWSELGQCTANCKATPVCSSDGFVAKLWTWVQRGLTGCGEPAAPAMTSLKAAVAAAQCVRIRHVQRDGRVRGTSTARRTTASWPTPDRASGMTN
jgi:hypothetical protein